MCRRTQRKRCYIEKEEEEIKGMQLKCSPFIKNIYFIAPCSSGKVSSVDDKVKRFFVSKDYNGFPLYTATKTKIFH